MKQIIASISALALMTTLSANMWGDRQHCMELSQSIDQIDVSYTSECALEPLESIAQTQENVEAHHTQLIEDVAVQNLVNTNQEVYQVENYDLFFLENADPETISKAFEELKKLTPRNVFIRYQEYEALHQTFRDYLLGQYAYVRECSMNNNVLIFSHEAFSSTSTQQDQKISDPIPSVDSFSLDKTAESILEENTTNQMAPCHDMEDLKHFGRHRYCES